MLKTLLSIDRPEFPVFVAVIILICAPILLIQQREPIANQIASYAYYLIAFGVALKIIRYKSYD